jgi:polar amino acid transport system substrate-binding protein
MLPRLILASLIGLAAMRSAQAQDAPLPALEKVQVVHDMLPAALQASGTLKLATDAHYPTCESFAEDGKTMVGFEPDLWAAIAQVLGVNVAATSIDFAGLIPGISSGRYDVAIECINDRPDREAQVTFIDYSYSVGSAVYYLKDNSKIANGDMLSLCGLGTGAQSGNAITAAVDLLSDDCVKNGKPKVTLSEVPQASAVMLGVYAGRFDFALSDAVAWKELQKVSPKPLAEFPFTLRPKAYLGMIVKKDSGLAEPLLAALKIVVDRGVYGKIWDKWEIGHAKLNDPGINLATTRPVTEASR